MATILFSGMVAADPGQGGATWAVLQYLLGLRRLGHEVFFVEPISSEQIRPSGAPLARSRNAAYFRRVMADHGLERSASLLLQGGRETVGLTYAELRHLACRADLLLNVSGMLAEEFLLDPIPLRVYLDLDPAFVQLWHAVEGIDMRFAAHHRFVTVGSAIGTRECPVPTCGLEWRTTLQPVVLSEWPVTEEIVHRALTTIGNWRGYGSIEHLGVHYGQKAHSLRPLLPLAGRCDESFVLGLSIHPGEVRDLAALRENGWSLVDPAQVAGTPEAYRRFIQGSKAEFGIAKSGYVASRCGWFSDRSVCYLASGRPVLAQETGFGRYLPTGEGLFAFTTEDDALAGIEEMNRDYPRHRRAARRLAEEYFDSDRVLPRLLDQVGLS